MISHSKEFGPKVTKTEVEVDIDKNVATVSERELGMDMAHLFDSEEVASVQEAAKRADAHLRLIDDPEEAASVRRDMERMSRSVLYEEWPITPDQAHEREEASMDRTRKAIQDGQVLVGFAKLGKNKDYGEFWKDLGDLRSQ